MLDSPLQLPEAEANFCPRDGTPLENQMKAGEMRRVCPTCGYIFGRDPRVMVGLLIERDRQTLFVRRSAGGQAVWSLPVYPLVERDDARQVAAAQLRDESGLIADVTGVADTFLVDDELIGTALLLLFRGQVSQAHSTDHDFAFKRSDEAISQASNRVTRQVLDHRRGAGQE